MTNTIREFQTSEIQFFDCILHKKQVPLNFQWVHFVYNLEKVVDYKRTIFTHPDENLHKKMKAINSYSSYIDFYENDDEWGLLRADKVFIDHEPLDFFLIGHFKQNIYVSERLKDEIFPKFTGFDLRKSSDIFFE